MKKNLTIALSLFISAPILAAESVDCGYLNIAVLNRTGASCYLSGTQLNSGRIVFGAPSQEIQNGSLSPNFRVQQSYTQGPSIRLNYDCQNKTVVLTSKQNLCFLQAGNISGSVDSSINMLANFVATPGSYWFNFPGQILWTIY